jgi:hypothetical protein
MHSVQQGLPGGVLYDQLCTSSVAHLMLHVFPALLFDIHCPCSLVIHLVRSGGFVWDDCIIVPSGGACPLT